VSITKTRTVVVAAAVTAGVGVMLEKRVAQTISAAAAAIAAVAAVMISLQEERLKRTKNTKISTEK
jgi:hypothetical protein